MTPLDVLAAIVRGAAILYLAGIGMAMALYSLAFGMDLIDGAPEHRYTRQRDRIAARIIAFSVWGGTFLVVALALGMPR